MSEHEDPQQLASSDTGALEIVPSFLFSNYPMGSTPPTSISPRLTRLKTKRNFI